jgi:ABC-type Fe3+ transport system permease subunit
MHTHNGMDLHGLLIIDYLFHLPLEVAGVVLALSFISLFRSYRSGNLTATTEPDVQGSLTGGPVR